MRRNHYLKIRVTKAEKESFESKAKELGLTLSGLLRWNTNEKIMEELQEIKHLLKNRNGGGC